MDHLEESLNHITSEIGILLVILLVLALLISIVQLRTINKLKRGRNEQAISQERKPETNETRKEETTIKKLNEAESSESTEDLKAQLKSKTIELAKVAKENDQKNQLLSDLRDKLLYLKEHPSALDRVTKDTLRLIDTVNIKNKDTFDIQIDELNQAFYNRLRTLFPELTINDLRLCAYVKIGMDSKEIANLFSIKPSSIYINRSRLRKKLNLDPEDDLYAFLNSDF